MRTLSNSPTSTVSTPPRPPTRSFGFDNHDTLLCDPQDDCTLELSINPYYRPDDPPYIVRYLSLLAAKALLDILLSPLPLADGVIRAPLRAIRHNDTPERWIFQIGGFVAILALPQQEELALYLISWIQYVERDL